MSLASALALRMRSGRFYRNVHNGCINLLLTYPDTCRASCDYCGLARERAAASAVPAKTEMLPLSVRVAPPIVDEARLRELQSAGVERIGIGLDAANERIFGRRRHGLSWSGYWHTVEAARRVFGPDRVNCHVVVGLGETDAELMEVCSRLKAMQVSSYLFSFYPESGTPMASARRPSLVRWRQLQLVTFLIERNLLQPEQVGFDDRGRLARLEMGPAQWSSGLADGRAFLTRGCPARNGEPFRDYPFPPEPADLQEIEEQLRLERLASG